MTRRSIVHVLLSLLLLVSQQLALSHAMAHWSGHPDGSARMHQGGGKVSKALAQDQSCEQCLSFAQIAGAVGSPTRSFAAVDVASCGVAATSAPGSCIRTVCVFQSRAPPSLA